MQLWKLDGRVLLLGTLWTLWSSFRARFKKKKKDWKFTMHKILAKIDKITYLWLLFSRAISQNLFVRFGSNLRIKFNLLHLPWKWIRGCPAVKTPYLTLPKRLHKTPFQHFAFPQDPNLTKNHKISIILLKMPKFHKVSPSKPKKLPKI